MKPDKQGYFEIFNGDIHLFGQRIGHVKMHTIDIFLVNYLNHVIVTFGKQPLDEVFVLGFRDRLKSKFFDFIEIINVDMNGAKVKVNGKTKTISNENFLYNLCEYHWLKDKPIESVSVIVKPYVYEVVKGESWSVKVNNHTHCYDDIRDLIWEQRLHGRKVLWKIKGVNDATDATT